MRANTIILIVFTSLLLWGCEKVEKLENFPLESPKTTVNCNLEENKDIVVEVTRSLSVIDGAQLKPIVDALVKVSYVKNGSNFSVSQQGVNDVQNNLEVYTLSLKPVPGIKYKIEVTSQKYGNVWSESLMPLPVSIDSVVQKIVDSSSYDYGGDYSLLTINQANSTIKFKDNLNEENYYALSHHIVIKNSISNSSSSYSVNINSNIPGTNIINGLVFFNDQTFNGMDYTIQYDWSAYIQLRNIKNDKVKGTYTLVSLTKDYYQYLISYNSYIENKDNPFADPVQVYNNIFGGYGIFVGSSSSYLSKVIK
jgi:hypothetical protein